MWGRSSVPHPMVDCNYRGTWSTAPDSKHPPTDRPRRLCAALTRPVCLPSTRAGRERCDRSPTGRGCCLAGLQFCCFLPHCFWASTVPASAVLPRPAVLDPSQGSPDPLPAALLLPAGACLLLPAVSGPMGAGQGQQGPLRCDPFGSLVKGGGHTGRAAAGVGARSRHA